ncbi:methyltransferase domain-containing protein [Patescibacteria group bacterium]|nr:MAG: methyltransferase domain-containing protein [Patescibacteria group bacterium]
MNNKSYGPDRMTGREKKKFFGFYKTHRDRALAGFLKDITKIEINIKTISKYLMKRKKINCLIMGCSHWANPGDTMNFLKSFNNSLYINLVVLDALPNALIEIIKHNVNCLPILTPAQKTPFLGNYFDIIICDCLLTCCSFDQHEPVVREMARIIKKSGLIILGIVHSKKRITFKMSERPIKNYSRPLKEYEKLFNKHGFNFPKKSSVETSLPGKWAQMKIENCIVRVK